MQERCLHMYMMRMFPLVCVSPMWLASIGQDLLVRVAVSSIHICVAAQELDVRQQAKLYSEWRTNRCFVCEGFFG